MAENRRQVGFVAIFPRISAAFRLRRSGAPSSTMVVYACDGTELLASTRAQLRKLRVVARGSR
jgi:hypothetical protein